MIHVHEATAVTQTHEGDGLNRFACPSHFYLGIQNALHYIGLGCGLLLQHCWSCLKLCCHVTHGVLSCFNGSFPALHLTLSVEVLDHSLRVQ
jgi:hypothetical protein